MNVYCGTFPPYVDYMELAFLNNTYLNIEADMPLRTITCNDQEYLLDKETSEIIFISDCIENELSHYGISDLDIYYENNEIDIESEGEQIVLEKC